MRKKASPQSLITQSPRRFWILGAAGALLLFHSYGIFSGIYTSLNIVPSDVALKIAGLELLFGVVLVPIFLGKSFVWYHDRGVRQKHVYDDPGILE